MLQYGPLGDYDPSQEFKSPKEISDQLNAPKPENYYNGDSCLAAISLATKGKSGVEAFMVGNIIKYLWRYEEKNGVQDVEKALDYCQRLLKHLNG